MSLVVLRPMLTRGSKAGEIQLRMGQGVTNLCLSQRILERTTIEGDSPVDERDQTPAGDLEYHGTREILWEAGRTTSQG